MNGLHHKIFNSSKTTPAIKTPPPTDEALIQYLLRCHLQVMIWKSDLEDRPPQVEISEYGWDVKNGIPHPVIDVNQVAPTDLLKLWHVVVELKHPVLEVAAAAK